jgi:hypothetical protein
MSGASPPCGTEAGARAAGPSPLTRPTRCSAGNLLGSVSLAFQLLGDRERAKLRQHIGSDRIACSQRRLGERNEEIREHL